MNMLVREIRFPITDGVIVSALKAGLLARGWAATGLTVQPKLPATKTRRMVTVRNDGGLQDGAVQGRGYGINVWADTSVDAENLALDCMAILRGIPSAVIPATSEFSGPFQVEDDPEYVVASKNLTHYYFSFTATVRGS